MAEQHKLPFEDKYSYNHAKRYYEKHTFRFKRRITMWFEARMASRALKLAGDPKTVLDLPCGYGRFWPTLKQAGVETLLASDQSEGMLAVAGEVHPASLLSNIRRFAATATDITLPDHSVDSVFCMRLLHHISDKDYRMAIYRSFQRVARETVIISYWITGNFRHTEKRRRGPESDDIRHVNRHFFEPSQIEAELTAAGFEILGYVNMLPYIFPWRTYVLKVPTLNA